MMTTSFLLDSGVTFSFSSLPFLRRTELVVVRIY